MQLEMVSREEYSNKNDTEFLERLSSKFDNPFIIPEGGANEWGREGSAEITEYITNNYTHVCVSVGTGTTLTGIRTVLPSNIQVLGYVPMKGGVYLKEEIDKYIELEKQDDYTLFDDWHSGGFGKWNDELISFMNSFHAINDIPLDIVYTGKMMMGISEQLKSGYFPMNAKILCIHTGGLQGNSSVKHVLSY
jgi:1-aminocyclopropane-1-carboxylate deaminase